LECSKRRPNVRGEVNRRGENILGTATVDLLSSDSRHPSIIPMDIVSPSELPGAGFDFCDVRNIFEDAVAGNIFNNFTYVILSVASRFGPGADVVHGGFLASGRHVRVRGDYAAAATIQRSTLGQIGEPRLDSGYIPPGDPKPTFDPLAPLLPEELCWIIDRSFSYEVRVFLVYTFIIIER
jgi:hypothetical protein